MKFAEIKPNVRSIAPRKYFSERKKTVQTHGCELLLIREGEGEVRITGHRALPVSAGSVILAPAEISYSVHPQDAPISSTAIEFDYVSEGEGRLLFEDTVCLNEPMAQSLKEMILSRWEKARIQILPTRGLDSYYAERSGLIISYPTAAASQA